MDRTREFRLQSGRKFTVADFLRIPLQISPLPTIVILIGQLVNALIPSLQVLVTARFVDTALAIFDGTAQRQDIYTPLLFILLIVLYSNVYWAVSEFFYLRMEIAHTKQFRVALVEKRSKLEYRHIEDNEMWDLITRTCRDPVERIMDGLGHAVGTISMAVRVVSLMTVLFAQVWWAGAVILALAVPLFILAVKGGRNVYDAFKEAEKYLRRSDYYHRVVTGRDYVEERSLFGYSEDINERWLERFMRSCRTMDRAQIKYVARMKVSSLMTVLVSLIIVFTLLLPLSRGEITVGMFIALITGFLSLVQMMSWELGWIIGQISTNRAYLSDLTTLCGLSEQDGALDEPAEAGAFRFESIDFRNVTFCYPGTERPILTGLDLRIEKNLHYAFVGINGAGKTTITKLLTGLYDNYEGEILLNGKDLRSYTQAQLKRIFSVVFQDYARYAVSVRENILLGDVSEEDDRRIEESVATIGFDEVVRALPNGMDTDLGKIREGATDLSGGEWQRVAIARTLYAKRAVRILDEPTAALDPVAESNVYEMFGRISAGITTIFITHRLGAAKLADEIIVIDGGKVAEQGSHSALMARKGIYSEMFDSQRSWYQ